MSAEDTALKRARHGLVTLHGLMAYDGAAPSEPFQIDTRATVEAIDDELSRLAHTDTST